MSEPITSLAALEASARIQRVTHRFTVPAALARETGVTELGLVQLIGREEIEAANMAGANPARLGFELAKRSLRFLDGKAMSDELCDEFWGKPEYAKLRPLVVLAYNRVNQPTQDDATAFLASLQITA